MSYYISIDPDGNIVDLHRDDYADVPVDAIAISEDDGELLKAGFTGYQYINGAVGKSAGQLAADHRAAIQSQIDALERKEQYPRLTREVLLAIAVREAAAQGVDEPTLYGANVGYQKLKDFDAQIAALRSQL